MTTLFVILWFVFGFIGALILFVDLQDYKYVSLSNVLMAICSSFGGIPVFVIAVLVFINDNKFLRDIRITLRK